MRVTGYIIDTAVLFSIGYVIAYKAGIDVPPPMVVLGQAADAVAKIANHFLGTKK